MCQTHRGSFCPNTSVIWQQFEIKPMLQKTINGYSRHISCVFLSLLFSLKKEAKKFISTSDPFVYSSVKKSEKKQQSNIELG